MNARLSFVSLLLLWMPCVAHCEGDPATDVKMREKVDAILQGGNTKATATLAEELAELGPPAADVLFHYSSDKIRTRFGLRGAAACRGALIRMGDQAAKAVAKYLHSPNEDERARAIEFMGRISAKSRTRDLIRLLTNPNVKTRLAAAESLGEIHDRSAILPLLAMAQNDVDPGCRKSALTAIVDFGPNGSEAIEGLYEMIRAADHKPGGIQELSPDETAIFALGALGPQAIDKFKEMLGPKSTFFPRGKGIRSLGN